MNSSKFLSRLFIFIGVGVIVTLGWVTSRAQYLETFSTPNKGYRLNCVNDFTTTPWFLTSWDPAGTCQVGDIRDPNDYFNTTAGGVLESIDLDQEVCWLSPLLNISGAGAVTSSVDLTWVGFDIDVAAGNCLGDYIRVSNSINGGPYTMVPNQVGGGTCATVVYAFTGPPGPFNSGATITQAGITGNTLRTSVCVFTNANAEIVTIDNVGVPQAGVSIITSAAAASIAGRVTTADGRGIGGAAVTISGGSPAQPRIARTSPFGYYTVEGLDAGETYVVSIGSKRHTFAVPSRVVSLNDSVSDVDFVADPFE